MLPASSTIMDNLMSQSEVMGHAAYEEDMKYTYSAVCKVSRA
jgi:hypothetical protein